MIKPNSNNQKGLIIVEAALAMVWYGIMFFFLLYIYEYIEANQESQIVASVKLRETMLADAGKCYSVASEELEGEVGVQYKLKPFFNEDSLPVKIKKVGFAGACPKSRQSRFDWSAYRQPRTPDGALIGPW